MDGLCHQRGSALLTVLWLSAALAAIAFSLSTTVRGEADRAGTSLDGLRAYYLASGAIQRCSMELLWSVMAPDKRKIPRGATLVHYNFPTGDVEVEITPETAKLDVNSASAADLYRLGMALGLEPTQAQQIATGIDAWRHPVNPGGFPTFQPSRTSFQEIEELLEVPGVTPEVFYGTYVREEDRLVARPGLVDCLSVFGAKDRVDANTASPAVLGAVGIPPYAVGALLARRKVSPLSESDLNDFMQSVGTSRARLRVEGNSIVTMRATARLRLDNGQFSDLKRIVSAQVKYMPPGFDSPIHILRWYDAR
jgi:general secretion pathway protein K